MWVSRFIADSINAYNSKPLEKAYDESEDTLTPVLFLPSLIYVYLCLYVVLSAVVDEHNTDQ